MSTSDVQDYRTGWYQVAFERDLEEGITPIGFSRMRLMALRQSGQPVRIFDATCPHRGAHLGYGGRLEGEAIVCPFHGHRVRLGAGQGSEFCIREYPSFTGGGMVFMQLSAESPADLPAAVEEIGRDHRFVSGFEMEAATSIEVVMENGFDNSHFRSVHGLLNEPQFEVSTGAFGELVAIGNFEIPRSEWNARSAPSQPVRASYRARAFSPGVVIASLGGEAPYNYHIITTAVPAPEENQCTLRLTLALPIDGNGGAHDDNFAANLLEASREGLKMDRAIWNRLAPERPARWTALDGPVIEFTRFCSRFRPPSET